MIFFVNFSSVFRVNRRLFLFLYIDVILIFVHLVRDGTLECAVLLGQGYWNIWVSNEIMTGCFGNDP